MFRSFAYHVNNSRGFCGAKISDQFNWHFGYACSWTDEKNSMCYCWNLNEAKARNMMWENMSVLNNLPMISIGEL